MLRWWGREQQMTTDIRLQDPVSYGGLSIKSKCRDIHLTASGQVLHLTRISLALLDLKWTAMDRLGALANAPLGRLAPAKAKQSR